MATNWSAAVMRESKIILAIERRHVGAFRAGASDRHLAGGRTRHSYGNPAATQIAMSNQNLGKICEVQNLVAPQFGQTSLNPLIFYMPVFNRFAFFPYLKIYPKPV